MKRSACTKTLREAETVGAVTPAQRPSVGYEFLPDHQAIESMLPEITSRYLAPDDALETIDAVPGLVPIAIDPTPPGRLYWADLGDRPFKEWQFLYTVKKAIAEGVMSSFYTDMRVLNDDAVVNKSAPVCGLIFHISRCGSTLLGKCLATSQENIVINQGGALQRGFWAWATNDFQRPLPKGGPYQAMFRRLVGSMARRRRDEWSATFIKLISWNALYLDFIKAAFPYAPAMFMYRDPVEVIAPVLKETTAVLLAKGTAQAEFLTGLPPQQTAGMSDARYLSLCYANYIRTALSEDSLSFLNYSDFRPDNLPIIFERGLGIRLTETQLTNMKLQFRVHSKDDNNKKVFSSDVAEKQAQLHPSVRLIVQEQLGPLFQKLVASEANVCRARRTDAVPRLKIKRSPSKEPDNC